MIISSIEIVVEGVGQETIVMIHGWLATYRLWNKQLNALKHLTTT